MFPRTAFSASTRRFAQGVATTATTLSFPCPASTPLLNRSFQSAARTPGSGSFTTSPLRSYLLNRSSTSSPSTTRSLFTSSPSSCSTRPANGSAPSYFFTSSLSSKQTKSSSTSSAISRSYTSLHSSASSSSSATATAGRVLAEESSSAVTRTAATGAGAAARTTTTPLSFHEEMTKVRFSFNWWKEWTIIMGVFAVTGSSTVMVVKPILKEVFQLDGSMREGPWSFRFAYLCTTLPLYSCVLLTVATVAGRRPYFKKVVLRMWGRFLPKKVIQRFQ